MLRNALNLSIHLKLTTNINSNSIRQRLVYSNWQKYQLFEIPASDDILSKYDRLKMTFLVQVININYWKMPIKSLLKWKLSKNEVNYNQLQIDNWLLCVCKTNFDDQCRQLQLSIKPHILPRYIYGLKVRYNLLIESNQTKLQLSGKMDTRVGSIRWNHSLFDLGTGLEQLTFVLNVTIMEIAGKDNDGTMVEKIDKSLWSESGFY